MLIPVFVSKTREMSAAALGGIAATATDVVALMGLIAMGVAIPVSAFLAASLGAVVCFAINKHVAFKDKTPLSLDQVARFAFVAVTNACALALLMKLFAVEMSVPVLPAKLISAAIVFVCWTYPAQRRLVFKRVPEPSPASSLA
jgi:putative flippase GtrA